LLHPSWFAKASADMHGKATCRASSLAYCGELLEATVGAEAWYSPPIHSRMRSVPMLLRVAFHCRCDQHKQTANRSYGIVRGRPPYCKFLTHVRTFSASTGTGFRAIVHRPVPELQNLSLRARTYLAPARACAQPRNLDSGRRAPV